MSQETKGEARSPEPREVTFTSYSSVRDTSGTPSTRSWAEWREEFLLHDIRGRSTDTDDPEVLKRNKDGPAVILAELPKGSHRSKDNVMAVHAIALDIDGCSEEQLKGLLARFEKYEYVAHTTHRSGAACEGGLLRVRIIFPLEFPLPVGQHKETWARLNQAALGLNDEATKDVSRLQLFPSTFDPAHARTWENKGKWINPLTDLPPVQAADKGSKPRANEKEAARSDGRGEIAEAAKRYNEDHVQDWPKSGGTCPMCAHNGCFGRLPDSEHRWACFSSGHNEPGKRGEGCFTGDALDIDAFEAGVSREEFLVQGGYLAPRFEHRKGEGHRSIAKAVECLCTEPDLYSRGEQLVTITTPPLTDRESLDGAAAPRIAAISRASLWENLSAAVRWQRYDKRSGTLLRCDPPSEVVAAIHDRRRWPGIRELTGVTTVPILRPDGTVHDREGYDAETGLLYRAVDGHIRVPANPGQEEARTAFKQLLEVVQDFPLVSDSARSGWGSGVLAGLGWSAFEGNAPMQVGDAHTPGSGKTLLFDAGAMVVTGAPAPRSPYVESDDEFRKRITAHVIAGDRFVLVDNVPNGGVVGWASLDNALTAGTWNDRILGRSEMARLPMEILWMVTGNNLSVRGDTARRSLRLRLEVEDEHPEERTGFTHEPLLPWIRQNRARLVAAGLTVLSAYSKAGRPDQGLAPMGSFEGWSSFIRSAIVWAGFPDPVECIIAREPDADPEREAHVRALSGWFSLEGGTSGLMASEVLTKLAEKPNDDHLKLAIVELCGTDAGNLPSTKELGSKLRALRGRGRTVALESGSFVLAFEKAATKGRGGANRWRVITKG